MALRKIGADPADRWLGEDGEAFEDLGRQIYVNELELGLRAASSLRLESAYGYHETRVQLAHVLGTKYNRVHR